MGNVFRILNTRDPPLFAQPEVEEWKRNATTHLTTREL